jgi:hypothetical protein
MRTDTFVGAKNDREIAVLADDLRLSLGVFDDLTPDLAEILETRVATIVPAYRLLVVEDDDCPYEAVTAYDPPSITLRRSTAEALAQRVPRARFTAAHELGHLFMHHSESRPRTVPRPDEDRIPALYSAERQANRFAACFLMPERLVRLQDIKSVGDAALIFGVSETVADRRLGELRMRPPRQLPDSIRRRLKEMGVEY